MKNTLLWTVLLIFLSACQSGPITFNDKHPYFDDGGALSWFIDNKEGGTNIALGSGKPIIIEVGRKSCHNCKVFVEEILPNKNVKDLLENFIGLKSDADSMSDKVKKLVMDNMRHATLLPVIIVLDKNAKYVGGLFGEIKSEQFISLLKKVK